MNIYVSNLPFTMKDEDLQATFEQFGSIDSAKVIRDKMSGRSRGFGFVEMPNSDEANTAISNLNGSEVGGRELKVSEAKPREEN